MEGPVVISAKGEVQQVPLSSSTVPLAEPGAGDERVKELGRLLAQEQTEKAQMARALAEKEAQMARALAENAQMAKALAEKEAQTPGAAEKTTAQTAQGQPKSGGWWRVMGRIKKVLPDTRAS